MATTPLSDLPKCSVCSAPLRPYKAPLSKWPGTKAKVSTRPLLCTAHQYHGKVQAPRDFTGHDTYLVKPEEARMVRRLISERFEGDDYMLMTEALGIGDDIE